MATIGRLALERIASKSTTTDKSPKTLFFLRHGFVLVFIASDSCEILNPTRSDVCLSPDFRSGVTESGQRAGIREEVTIDRPLLCRMLAVRFTTTLFAMSVTPFSAQFRKLFADVIKDLGLK